MLATLDPDTIVLEELEDQRQCESPNHPLHTLGHAEGPLFWVLFYCACHKDGLTIRCEPWLRTNKRRAAWVCARCGRFMETKEWYDVIGPVE